MDVGGCRNGASVSEIWMSGAVGMERLSLRDGCRGL
jgi:hypothetical protein